MRNISKEMGIVKKFKWKFQNWKVYYYKLKIYQIDNLFRKICKFVYRLLEIFELRIKSNFLNNNFKLEVIQLFINKDK